MSGGLVLGAAGAVVGSFFGMPGLGFSIGSALGGFLDKPDTPAQQRQPLQDLKVTGTEYGQPIPVMRGRWRTAGQMWWNSDKLPISVPGEGGDDGGKGGSPAAPTQDSVTYDIDLLIGLHDDEIIGVSEIYHNKKLIYRVDSDASAGTIAASEMTEYWDRLTVYTGEATQLPDPDYEAWVDANVGAGLAPAYRKRGTVFIKGLHLGQSGALPLLEFTVVVDGTRGPELNYYDGTSSAASVIPQTFANVAIDPTRGKVWFTDIDHASGDSQDRIAILDIASGTFSYILLESPFVSFGGSSPIEAGIHMFMVPEWDKVFVQTTGPGRTPLTTLVYSISSQEFLVAFDDHFGGEGAFSHTYLVGLDVPNNKGLMHIRDAMINEFRIITFNDGMPASQFEGIAHAGLGGNVIALCDNEGFFWTPISGSSLFERINTGGHVEDTVAYGADGCDESTMVFDPSRNTIFYWSAIGSNEYLKKIDCLTGTISRVSGPWAVGGVSPARHILVYAEDRDSLLAMNVMGGSNTIWELDPDDGSEIEQHVVPVPNGNTFWGRTFGYMPGVIYGAADTWVVAGSEKGIAEYRFDVLNYDCPSVPDVQSGICVRSGLTTSQINVAPLNTITRDVCAFLWSQVSPGRVPSEVLMTGYFYEAVMSGSRIKFVPRGGSTVATIPFVDMGAHDGGGSPEPFPLRKNNDVELPAWTDVTYANLASNFQNDTQPSDRLVSATGVTRNPIEMALGFQPSEAKAVADTISLDQAASCMEATITVLRPDYPTLEPTDPIMLTASDGSLFRMRVVAIQENFPLMTLKAILDDTSVLTSQGITSTDYDSQTTVAAPSRTQALYLDIPILRDADDDAGFYAVAKGESPWPGAAIFNSPDNITYTRKATFNAISVFGTCVDALGDWSGPRVFDLKNSVQVNVGDATLTSSTRAAVLGNSAVNAFLIGDEIVQAIDAEIDSDGYYTLRRLLRGCRGTEWAMTGHVAGERCVLLRESGVRRIQMNTSEIGVARYYRAVTIGRTLGTASAQSFTDNGVGKKPFSPARVRVTHDGSDNATITIARRTRLSVRMTGSLGISVPLGEETEAYSIDFYTDNTFTAIADTQSVSGNSLAYTAAMQTAAGLTPGDCFNMDVHMISATVGRGYPLRVRCGGGEPNLWGWGFNSSGEIGVGGTAPVVTPTAVGVESDWAQVIPSSGDTFTLAVKANGTLWAWGNGGNGNLGQGDTVDHDTPVQIGSATDWLDAQFELGGSTYALKTDGTLWAWGLNASGQLGLGHNTTPVTSPTQVGVDTDWSAIASRFNTNFLLALKTGGTIWTCGENSNGQLGHGDTTDRNTLTQVGSDTNWQKIHNTTGGARAFVIKTTGALYAWGVNSGGSLGVGDTSPRDVPTQVGVATDWASVWSAGDNTFSIKTNGQLWAWGQNSNGELGLNDTSNHTSPVQVGSDTDWESVAAGFTYSIAKKTGGSLWSTGYNNEGQLAQGDTTARDEFEQIGSATDWDAVSVNFNDDCIFAIKDDGTIYGWGAGSFTNGLGLNTSADVLDPTQIGAETWNEIAAGGQSGAFVIR